MMKCREYIFLLTSGRLEQAPAGRRMEAGMHRLMCRKCRAFTRNDSRLDSMLADYREALRRDEAGPEN
ncbi:MAG: hypothetical protein K0Q68_771 [Moraxellaceae bacterium]|jgi:hypothetical protein|nr:hypothetical protein [Moraxellaceae bacterium]